MRFKKPFLLFILSVVVLGILGFSIWYRWSTEQKLAQQHIPELTPSAEFNHGAWISDVAISPVNSDIIASVGQRSVVKVWDRNSPHVPTLTLTDHPVKEGDDSIILDYIAFSPTGEWLVSKDFWNIAFWDATSGMEINVIEIPCLTEAVSPDGHLLATASSDVRLWDIRNPKAIKPIVILPRKMGEQPLSHEEAESGRHYVETINQDYGVINFSSDGKWIAAGVRMYAKDNRVWRNKVKVWDLQSRQLVKTFLREPPKGNSLHGIRSISFSADNRFFASVDSYGYTIWKLPEWQIHYDTLEQTATESTVDKPVRSFRDLAFSPDGQMYVVTESGAVTLYSTQSGNPIVLLQGGLLSNDGVKFSNDGNTIVVSGGMGGIVRLWDVGGLNEK